MRMEFDTFLTDRANPVTHPEKNFGHKAGQQSQHRKQEASKEHDAPTDDGKSKRVHIRSKHLNREEEKWDKLHCLIVQITIHKDMENPAEYVLKIFMDRYLRQKEVGSSN